MHSNDAWSESSFLFRPKLAQMWCFVAGHKEKFGEAESWKQQIYMNTKLFKWNPFIALPSVKITGESMSDAELAN